MAMFGWLMTHFHGCNNLVKCIPFLRRSSWVIDFQFRMINLVYDRVDGHTSSQIELPNKMTDKYTHSISYLFIDLLAIPCTALIYPVVFCMSEQEGEAAAVGATTSTPCPTTTVLLYFLQEPTFKTSSLQLMMHFGGYCCCSSAAGCVCKWTKRERRRWSLCISNVHINSEQCHGR